MATGDWDDCWGSSGPDTLRAQLETVIKERAELARELYLTKKQLGEAQVLAKHWEAEARALGGFYTDPEDQYEAQVAIDDMAAELQEAVDKLGRYKTKVRQLLNALCKEHIECLACDVPPQYASTIAELRNEP